MGARLSNSGCEIGTKNGGGCEMGDSPIAPDSFFYDVSVICERLQLMAAINRASRKTQ